MESRRLLNLVYNFAVKNNYRFIPFPKQPFNSNNEKYFIKDVEDFLLHPELSYLNKNKLINVKDVSLINIENYFKKKV